MKPTTRKVKSKFHWLKRFERRPARLLLVTISVVAYLSGAGPATLAPSHASAATVAAATSSIDARAGAPLLAQLQVVLDTSASVPMTYKLAALSAIANAVSSWPQPIPAIGGSAARPALNVQIRGVSGTSYAPEGVLGTWSVRGITAVTALPKTVTPDFTDRVIAYKSEHAAATVACKAATADARRAAAGLRGLRPKTTYASEIEGAVSAAAQSFSPAGIRKLVIVSDLAQNRRAQIAGSLKGVDVLVAHICWNASTCTSQEKDWGTRLRDRGATSVTFVRIERFATAVTTFLGDA